MASHNEKRQVNLKYPIVRTNEGWTITIRENKSIGFSFGEICYVFNSDEFHRVMGHSESMLVSSEAVLQRVDKHAYTVQKTNCTAAWQQSMPFDVLTMAFELVCTIQAAEFNRRFPSMIRMQGTFHTIRPIQNRMTRGVPASRIVLVHGMTIHIHQLLLAVLTRLIYRRLQCITLENCPTCQKYCFLNRRQCNDSLSFGEHQRCNYNRIPSMRYVQLAWLEMMPCFLGVKEVISLLIHRYTLDLDPAYIMDWVNDSGLTLRDIHGELVRMSQRGHSLMYNTIMDEDVHTFCACYMSTRNSPIYKP